MSAPINIKSLSSITQRIEYLDDYEPDDVLRAIEGQAAPLQITRKRSVCRHGKWVVKTSRFNGGIGPLKHSLKRKRYRVGWNASVALTNRGVPVARPVAFLEQRFMGVIWTNILVTEFLEGCQNIQEYFASHISESEEKMTFLKKLADAIGSFHEAGAHNLDSKVQNIMTSDGSSFHFIDLDEVVLDKPYPIEVRLKNHIQLIYGMRDHLSDEEKVFFLESLGTGGVGVKKWVGQVDEGVRSWVSKKEKLNEKLGPTID